MTSGSAGVYLVHFEFSEDWDGLTRTAVFKAGEKSISVLLNASGTCTIPWEVLTGHGRVLLAGVYGVGGEDVVLATAWAGLGTILEGARPGEDARELSPEVYEQVLGGLAGKADGLNLDGSELFLTAEGKAIASIVLPPGGTFDHRLLIGRDAENQHPMESITGLVDELGRIPAPVEPLTNEELEGLLK